MTSRAEREISNVDLSRIVHDTERLERLTDDWLATMFAEGRPGIGLLEVYKKRMLGGVKSKTAEGWTIAEHYPYPEGALHNDYQRPQKFGLLATSIYIKNGFAIPRHETGQYADIIIPKLGEVAAINGVDWAP